MQTVEISKVTLPKNFLFDRLKLFAKLITRSIFLAEVSFDNQQYMHERVVFLNVSLKLPYERDQFVLEIQVSIVNLDAPGVEIPIDLGVLGEERTIQLRFLTEMGRIHVDMNVIEEIYLPLQDGWDSSEEGYKTSDLSREKKGVHQSAIFEGSQKKLNRSARSQQMIKSTILEESKQDKMKGSIIRQNIPKKTEEDNSSPKYERPKQAQEQSPKPHRGRPKFEMVSSMKKQMK